MKKLKKFSEIKSEEEQLLESIKEKYGNTADAIIKQLGFSSIDEISKEKKLLTRLESLLKTIPAKDDISEDGATEIEEKEKEKGSPKSLEDKKNDKEPGNTEDPEDDDVYEEEDENEEEEEEEDENEEEEEEEDENEEEEEEEEIIKSSKIKSFDEFVNSEYGQESNISKEEEEDESSIVENAHLSEAEIKSDKEFEEYATEILKAAHGDDYDEEKAKEVIDGLKSKYDGDYGAMVGALQSSMG